MLKRGSLSTQVIFSASNVATLSPCLGRLGRLRYIRGVSPSDTASSTSALPSQNNLDGQQDTKNDFTIGNQTKLVMAIAAAGVCMSIWLLVTLIRRYKARLFAPLNSHALEVFSPESEFHGSDMRIDPFTSGACIGLDPNTQSHHRNLVSAKLTTPLDSKGRQGFGPLGPVILISRDSYSSVDTTSYSSPTSPSSRDRKPRPPPLAVVPHFLSHPTPTGVQGMVGPSGKSALLTVSSHPFPISMLPKTPPPIYSEATPSNHSTLAVRPLPSNK